MALGAASIFLTIDVAFANPSESSYMTGETHDRNGQVIQISYTAIDHVRFPSIFGGYPLPSPDDPLRLTASVDSIPPTQEDVNRYYRDFDGYELLGTDFCYGVLHYVYTWSQGTAREEAEAIYQEELASRPSETELEEERKYADKVNELAENGDVETIEKLDSERAGYIAPTSETISQEEIMRISLNDIEQNLENARARGSKAEIAQLESELANRKAELAQEEASNDQNSNDETAMAIAVASIIAASAIAIAVVAASTNGKRKRPSTDNNSGER